MRHQPSPYERAARIVIGIGIFLEYLALITRG